MTKIAEMARRFRSEDEGAAMIEYSVLIGIVTVAAITMIIAVGGWVTTQWTTLDTNLPG
ncbi:Flp family type IVb pilin [Devosia sp. XJ19-1]|uniref:Flp family type IVb pilin n=1 Tax=Devosia ureilytica TaxID=2952754 RepID=A0A9Q4AP77_9HYPH|nr:Flp family type IVb pilin [Devosia ureilytica]MCP8883584.1 Flp family type IVb pilin [Devosia ureilytica]MCP8887192.1 Flp family type IVb pilin [Devosia ureilytica]